MPLGILVRLTFRLESSIEGTSLSVFRQAKKSIALVRKQDEELFNSDALPESADSVPGVALGPGQQQGKGRSGGGGGGSALFFILAAVVGGAAFIIIKKKKK